MPRFNYVTADQVAVTLGLPRQSEYSDHEWRRIVGRSATLQVDGVRVSPMSFPPRWRSAYWAAVEQRRWAQMTMPEAFNPYGFHDAETYKESMRRRRTLDYSSKRRVARASRRLSYDSAEEAEDDECDFDFKRRRG